jgi:hypothetical protein
MMRDAMLSTKTRTTCKGEQKKTQNENQHLLAKAMLKLHIFLVRSLFPSTQLLPRCEIRAKNSLQKYVSNMELRHF